jgi:hypothetical protein
MVSNELHALATSTSSKELQWALLQYWSTTLYLVHHNRKDDHCELWPSVPNFPFKWNSQLRHTLVIV